MSEASKLQVLDAAAQTNKGSVNVTRRARDAQTVLRLAVMPSDVMYAIDDLFTRLDSDGNGVLTVQDYASIGHA